MKWGMHRFFGKDNDHTTGKPLLVRLSKHEREELEQISRHYGVTLNAAVRMSVKAAHRQLFGKSERFYDSEASQIDAGESL